MYKKWLFIPVASVSFILLLTLSSFLGIFPQGTATGETTDSQILESLNTAFIEVAKMARAKYASTTSGANSRALAIARSARGRASLSGR